MVGGRARSAPDFHPRFKSRGETRGERKGHQLQRLIARELMDDDEALGSLEEWRDSFRDLARVNSFLGGWSALRHALEQLPALPRRFVDVGAGDADVTLRVLRYLEGRRVKATCVAVDHSERILEIARQRIAQQPRAVQSAIALILGDARALPFEARSFDLATLNLSLHHFEPPDAVQVLSELARVADSVIVNDLRRSRVAWVFATAVFPVFTTNRFTRNDGPVSVLRSYTPVEA